MKMDIQFQINQLRQDKIIYAVEAIAINLACFLAFLVFQSYIVLFIGISYTIFMLWTNLQRLRKILRLEKQL